MNANVPIKQVVCEHCSKSFDETNTRCPNCGYPYPIKLVCDKCGFKSIRRHLLCPKCRSILFGGYDFVLWVTGEIFLIMFAWLVWQLNTAKDRSYAIGLLVIGTSIISWHCLLANKAYRAQVKRIEKLRDDFKPGRQ